MFYGKWEVEFDKNETNPEMFHGITGSADIHFMNNEGHYNYAEGVDFKALELFYKGEEKSMLIILPDATAFSSWESSIDILKVNEIIDSLGDEEVLIKIPKFEYSASFSLKDILQSMGMERAFISSLAGNPSADFSGIAHEPSELGRCYPLYIANVYHKVFIGVSEKDTSAAAATAAVVNIENTGGPVAPKTFYANHPFIYLIRDTVTGGILFVGRFVNKP